MSERTGFSSNCEIAIGNTYNTCGTVTRAKLSVLSPEQIKALYYGTDSGYSGQEGWTEMRALLKHQIEMRACGFKRNPLYEWLMSSSRPGMGKLVNITRSSRGPSLISPFILGRQQSLWNADHWALTDNVASSAYAGTATFAASFTSNSRVLSVSSSFGGTMELHADYFLGGKRLHVMARGAGGVLTVTQWKIVQAAVQAAGDKIDVEVLIDQPPKTPVSVGDAAAAIEYAPTATKGIIFLGINNVADVEYWCRNPINVNTNKLVPFWYQTRRTTRCVSEQYEEMMGHLMENNEWYSIFGDTPMAERNRQDEYRDQVEWMNAYFFGERISKYQTLDKWGDLEAITTLNPDGTPGAMIDPGTGNELMGYRANMIGVIPQLADCGRLIDNAGSEAGFAIKNFLENDVWDLVRARRQSGRPSTEVDIWTDETSAFEFMQAYIAYSKAVTGDVARINIEQGFTEWGFPFRRLRLYKPAGVFVNLVTDDFFNDLSTAAGYSTSGAGPFGAGASGLGKFLMLLDQGQGGTIFPSVLSTNRKQHTVGDINELARIDKTYSCVMENPKAKKTLTSTTTTAIVECPANSLVVANFDKIVSGV